LSSQSGRGHAVGVTREVWIDEEPVRLLLRGKAERVNVQMLLVIAEEALAADLVGDVGCQLPVARRRLDNELIAALRRNADPVNRRRVDAVVARVPQGVRVSSRR
jgi:hypothetical protein